MANDSAPLKDGYIKDFISGTPVRATRRNPA